LRGLATVLAISTLTAAFLYRRAGLRMHDATQEVGAAYARRWDVFVRLFAGFFLAASASLMVMSQAAGIVAAYGGSLAVALGTTTFITGAIAAARIGGGWLVDRFTMPRVAVGAHVCSLSGAVLLTLIPTPLVALPALAMIGMGHGFISGPTASCISYYWHRNAFGRVAGQLYIAWCLAAVCLPLLSGWLFDRTQGYGTAVMIAAGGNVLGVLIALGLPRPEASAPALADTASAMRAS
jgi:MFS family permease